MLQNRTEMVCNIKIRDLQYYIPCFTQNASNYNWLQYIYCTEIKFNIICILKTINIVHR